MTARPPGPPVRHPTMSTSASAKAVGPASASHGWAMTYQFLRPALVP